MKALSAATFLILAILAAGCGPLDTHPTQPTDSSPTQLSTPSPSLSPRVLESTATAQPFPTPADVTSPTRTPTPAPTPRPTPAPTATPLSPTATFPPPAEHETAFLRSLSSQDLACVPSRIRTDDQFWELMGFVTIYDDPEDRPPEFNCMSDDGKFLTYVMGYFEQYTVIPEDYERFPKLTPTYHRHYPKLYPASQECMLETLGQVEHPQRDPDDTEALEAFNWRVLSGFTLIPAHCLTDEELRTTGLRDPGMDYTRCFLKEVGGPAASINAMTGVFTGDVEGSEVEQRAREADMACSVDEEPPQTTAPTP